MSTGPVNNFSYTTPSQNYQSPQGTNGSSNQGRVPLYMPYMLSLSRLLASVRQHAFAARQQYERGRPTVVQPPVSGSRSSGTSAPQGPTLVVGGTNTSNKSTGSKTTKKSNVNWSHQEALPKDTLLSEYNIWRRGKSMGMDKVGLAADLYRGSDVAIPLPRRSEQWTYEENGKMKTVQVSSDTVQRYEIWRHDGKGSLKLIGLASQNPDAPQEAAPSDSAPAHEAANGATSDQWSNPYDDGPSDSETFDF